MPKLKDKFKALKNVINDIDIKSYFVDDKEKAQAVDLLGKYLLDYTIDSVAEKNSLSQLIYLEILNFRLQNIVNTLHKEDGSVPLNIVEAIHKNVAAIVLLKDKMGISKDRKQETQNDAFKALDLLKQKAKRWREENEATRHRACPYCGQMVLWLMRPEEYEIKKHPMFKDRVLANEHLIRLYLAGKLSKEDVSKILGTSPEYTTWLVEKMWKTNPAYNQGVISKAS